MWGLGGHSPGGPRLGPTLRAMQAPHCPGSKRLPAPTPSRGLSPALSQMPAEVVQGSRWSCRSLAGLTQSSPERWPAGFRSTCTSGMCLRQVCAPLHPGPRPPPSGTLASPLWMGPGAQPSCVLHGFETLGLSESVLPLVGFYSGNESGVYRFKYTGTCCDIIYKTRNNLRARRRKLVT